MQSVITYPHHPFLMEMGNYDRLFEKYYTALVFFAHRLIQQRENAEDIVSNVFVMLWEKRYGFESELKVKAFLYISTKNACFNARKLAQRRGQNHNAYRAVLSEEDGCALDGITRAEVLSELHALVQTLPQQCRRILIMRMTGMDNEAISQKLRLSLHTVKNQVSRGLTLLRNKIKDRSDLLLFTTIIFTEIKAIS